MKKSVIANKADKIIKDIFCVMITSEDKSDWMRGFDFIDAKIQVLEATNRGEEMFVWKKVKSKLNSLYGKKFILNNKITNEHK